MDKLDQYDDKEAENNIIIESWRKFQMLPIYILLKAAKGEVDLNEWAEIELANLGMNREGNIIGFDDAYKILKSEGKVK